MLLSLIGTDKDIAAIAPAWLGLRRSLKIEASTEPEILAEIGFRVTSWIVLLRAKDSIHETTRIDTKEASVKSCEKPTLGQLELLKPNHLEHKT